MTLSNPSGRARRTAALFTPVRRVQGRDSRSGSDQHGPASTRAASPLRPRGSRVQIERKGRNRNRSSGAALPRRPDLNSRRLDETSLTHHRHPVIHAGQHLRHQIRRSVPVSREILRINKGRRACVLRLQHLFAHARRGLRCRHWSEARLRVERVAQAVSKRRLDKAVEEGLPHCLMDVEALDRAARLAAVEEAAVDQSFEGGFQVGVGADIGRILAAEPASVTENRGERRPAHRLRLPPTR